MVFQPGNKLGKGRPKKKSTIIKEFAKAHPMAVDALMEMLYNLAMKKSDKEAAQYIIDRLKGRPHQSIEQTIKGQITITPGDLKLQVLAIKELKEEPHVFNLAEAKSVTDGTGTNTDAEDA